MGKLTIVGIGPGNYDNMTIAADRALRESQLIVGYTVYVDLVQERYPGKELLSTPATLNQIAEKTGYYNSLAMIRVFKRYEGETPGKYREKLTP